jgi:hypothetical protein
MITINSELPSVTFFFASLALDTQPRSDVYDELIDLIHR